MNSNAYMVGQRHVGVRYAHHQPTNSDFFDSGNDVKGGLEMLI